MSQLTLTHSPYHQEFAESSAKSFRRVRMTPMKWQFQFGPMTAIVGLMILGIIISIVYLMYFNQVATKGYAVNRLEADRQQLMDQNQVSSMSIDDAKSMKTILNSPRIQTMVAATKVTFVRGDSALASADVGS